MLPGRPTTAHARGRVCAGHDWGDPRSLTAQRHRWCRHTSWVPHSHGLGRWWQLEGSVGALSASLPSDLPGKVPKCGATAPLVHGACKAHSRTGPSCGSGGGGGGGTIAEGLGSRHRSVEGSIGRSSRQRPQQLAVPNRVGASGAHLHAWLTGEQYRRGRHSTSPLPLWASGVP